MSYFLDDFNYGIFDRDGTLINSMGLYTNTFVDILVQHGINPQTSRKYYQRSAGAPLNQQIATMLSEQQKENFPELIRQLQAEFFEIVDSVPPESCDGVNQLLLELRKRGMILFVTTGSRNPLEKMEMLALDHFFDKVMGSDEIPKGIEHIHVFAEHLGLDVPDFCKKAFLVGDGPADMMLGKKMRIYSIGITNTVSADALMQAGADETVSNLIEILEI